MIDEIKQKTTKWTPIEVDENHFRHHDADSLYQLGLRDREAPTVPQSIQQALKYATDLVQRFTGQPFKAGEGEGEDELPDYWSPPGGYP